MTRPDPRQVPKRPMARPGQVIALVGGRAEVTRRAPLFGADGRVDVDTLHRVVEAAAAVREGRAYPAAAGPVFAGSTLLTLVCPEAGDLPRLAEVCRRDGRAASVLRDRLHRELARRLGPDTPAQVDFSIDTEVDAAGLRVTLDFEAPLDPSAAATGS